MSSVSLTSRVTAPLIGGSTYRLLPKSTCTYSSLRVTARHIGRPFTTEPGRQAGAGLGAGDLHHLVGHGDLGAREGDTGRAIDQKLIERVTDTAAEHIDPFFPRAARHPDVEGRQILHLAVLVGP